MEVLTMGERLMLYRKRAGLSKKDLSLKSGVSVSTISRYEDDCVAPSQEPVSRLASALNMTANKLISGFDDPAKEAEEL